MTTFEALNLPPAILSSLARLGLHTPTPIQQGTIPLALQGSDILASAQTGSGKTLAFSIPLIVNLLADSKQTALILTPTRELAAQIQASLNQLLGRTSPLKMALLIGGAPIFPQIRSLKQRPNLIIGTPGRVNDHLERGNLNLRETSFLVLDEADRMLDMGFGIQIDRIVKFLPEERQTLMFSATFPPNIDKLSKKHLKNPQRISVAESPQSAPKIKQELIWTTQAEKLPKLLSELHKREGSIVIFTKTKRGAEKLAKNLQAEGHSSNAIHGDLSQNRRDRTIREFRTSTFRILVATDVAARGLDIPHIKHVINYDLPQCPEDYIHRIGRTGRAGAEGEALSLVLSAEASQWKAIARLLPPQEGLTAARAPDSRGASSSGSKPNKPAHPHFPAKRAGQNNNRKLRFGPRRSQPYAGPHKHSKHAVGSFSKS